ncbi:MAG: hypothetical protein JW774_12650 [Candidatus Aureabacteria bacterium]|nr:hypothetical protein [Candidatus Auribacterota bacterium]
MKQRSFCPLLFTRSQKGFTLMEVLLTSFLITYVIVSTVETFLFISRVLEYARSEREFLHQIILTDQMLKNVVLSSTRIGPGSDGSGIHISGHKNHLLSLDKKSAPPFSFSLLLSEWDGKQQNHHAGRLLLSGLKTGETRIKADSSGRHVSCYFVHQNDFSFRLNYALLPLFQDIRWRRIR